MQYHGNWKADDSSAYRWRREEHESGAKQSRRFRLLNNGDWGVGRLDFGIQARRMKGNGTMEWTAMEWESHVFVLNHWSSMDISTLTLNDVVMSLHCAQAFFCALPGKLLACKQTQAECASGGRGLVWKGRAIIVKAERKVQFRTFASDGELSCFWQNVSRSDRNV